MLSKLRIINFKAWEDTGEIRLAPLTLIFGANSIGKSSLGHLLIALQQTLASSDRMHLGLVMKIRQLTLAHITTAYFNIIRI